MSRPIYEIATEIKQDIITVTKSFSYAVVHAKYRALMPYLDAMSSLEDMSSRFGAESASSIIAYFLANAGQWKGETARRVKAELNSMLKSVEA